MPAALTPDAAGAVLRRGGIVAYPTEAVWGLGCDPFDADAVQRLLDLKRRPAAKGMIVIAADLSQVIAHLHWDDLPETRRDAILASWPGPNTWLIPCKSHVPEWLRGDHDTLAVRITTHPIAAALCRAFQGPVVSTSANRAGEPPARILTDMLPDLLSQLDGWLEGDTSGLAQPSTIRDARGGDIVRGQ